MICTHDLTERDTQRDITDRLAAENKALREAMTAAEADAERYRWLRLAWDDIARANNLYGDTYHDVWVIESPDALDEFIDARRKP